jgi:hypothetical protein
MRGRRQAYPNLGWGSNRLEGLWIRLDGGWLAFSFCRGWLVNLVLQEGFVGKGVAMVRDGYGEWVDPKDVSGEIHKDVLAVVRVLAVSGWRLRRQGHKFYMYCPCGSNGAQLRVDGTPRNSTQRAKILLRDARRCPGQHELLRGRR